MSPKLPVTAVDEQGKPLIEYPVAYPFKVMGKQEGFREYVHQLFARLLGRALAPEAVEELPSNKGTYVSLTVTVHLESEDQRRGIYEALHREERIRYYL
jgi:hypothetical protein